MDIVIKSQEAGPVLINDKFIYSSYNLLSGYFSSSKFERVNLNSSSSVFTVFIDDQAAILLKIVSLDTINSYLQFSIFSLGLTKKILDNTQLFECLSLFLTHTFNVSRICTSIFSSESNLLLFVSNFMQQEAVLKEQMFVNGVYQDLILLGYNIR